MSIYSLVPIIMHIKQKSIFNSAKNEKKNQKCSQKTKNQDTQTDSDLFNQKLRKNPQSNISNGKHNRLYNETKQKLKFSNHLSVSSKLFPNLSKSSFQMIF